VSDRPHPDCDEAAPTGLPRSAEQGTLGVGATLGLAVLIFLIAQAVGTVIIWLAGKMPASEGVVYDGSLVALVTLVTNPVQIVLLGAVARWRVGADPFDYLGLVPFTWRDFVIGLLAVVGLVAAVEGASWLAGLEIVSSFQTESYSTARAQGWLLPLVLAVVVVGPVGEEVIFRGFLFRGWVTPGPHGVFAIIVIAELWAGMHVQYDWLGMSQVFLTGLLLGWIRWRSGSTWLTIVLHMLVNLEGTLEAMAKIGWTQP
jgi:CAAX protease family protein